MVTRFTGFFFNVIMYPFVPSVPQKVHLEIATAMLVIGGYCADCSVTLFPARRKNPNIYTLKANQPHVCCSLARVAFPSFFPPSPKKYPTNTVFLCRRLVGISTVRVQTRPNPRGIQTGLGECGQCRLRRLRSDCAFALAMEKHTGMRFSPSLVTQISVIEN